MRCPKCGFHSFDHLDNCKKCGRDLTGLKGRFTFRTYAAPTAPVTVPVREEPPLVVPAVAEAEEEAIDFGFDVLEEAEVAPRPEFADDTGSAADTLADWGVNDPAAFEPTAIDLAVDGGLDFDQPLTADGDLDFDQPFPADTGLDFDQPRPVEGDLNFDQPFPEDGESFPDDDLPKFNNRF